MSVIIPDLKPPYANNAWQQHCTLTLQKCLERGAVAASEWAQARSVLFAQAEKVIAHKQERRIIIADVDLSGRDLRGFNFQWTYFIRTNLSKANLRKTNFIQCIINECDLRNANAKHTNFDRAVIKNCDLQGLKYNWRTNLALIGQLNNRNLSSVLEDRILQQQAARNGTNAPLFMRLLFVITGHGYAVWRLALACAVVMGFFALLYWSISAANFIPQTANGERHGFITFILFSIERFVNANPWISGINAGHFWTTLESVLGVIAVSILTAMITRKILRP